MTCSQQCWSHNELSPKNATSKKLHPPFLYLVMIASCGPTPFSLPCIFKEATDGYIAMDGPSWGPAADIAKVNRINRLIIGIGSPPTYIVSKQEQLQAFPFPQPGQLSGLLSYRYPPLWSTHFPTWSNGRGSSSSQVPDRAVPSFTFCIGPPVSSINRQSISSDQRPCRFYTDQANAAHQVLLLLTTSYILCSVPSRWSN